MEGRVWMRSCLLFMTWQYNNSVNLADPVAVDRGDSNTQHWAGVCFLNININIFVELPVISSQKTCILLCLPVFCPVFGFCGNGGMNSCGGSLDRVGEGRGGQLDALLPRSAYTCQPVLLFLLLSLAFFSFHCTRESHVLLLLSLFPFYPSLKHLFQYHCLCGVFQKVCFLFMCPHKESKTVTYAHTQACARWIIGQLTQENRAKARAQTHAADNETVAAAWR